MCLVLQSDNILTCEWVDVTPVHPMIFPQNGLLHMTKCIWAKISTIF